MERGEGQTVDHRFCMDDGDDCAECGVFMGEIGIATFD